MAPGVAGPTPDALAPPPDHPRFPLLDGMRAIAVLAVVIVHVAFFAHPGSAPAPDVLMHLNIGVTIFFLISGFLLYRPFIAHRAGGGRAPAAPVYLKRRALRIFPAYWAALTILTILPGTTAFGDDGWLGQYSLLFMLPFNGFANDCADIPACGLAQTWSLAVELTFYLALPLWVLLSNRLCRGRSPRGWVPIELGALAAIGVGSVVLHFGFAPQADLVTTTAAGYLLWFALGMSLAVLSVAFGDLDLGPLTRSAWIPWLAGAVLYVVVCIVLPPVPFLFDTRNSVISHVAFGLIALLLMLPAVFGDRAGGWPRSLLSHPAMAWLGLISYGIFLWHYVVAVEFGSLGSDLSFWPLLCVTLAISVAAATASYYCLERPALRFKYRRGPARPPNVSAEEGSPTGAG